VVRSNGAVLAVALWEGSDESSVGITKGFWLEGRDFSFRHRVQAHSGAFPACYRTDAGSFSLD
jgi:hypothetical protein